MGANPEMTHVIIIWQYLESNYYKYAPSSKGKHTWTEQENVLRRQKEFFIFSNEPNVNFKTEQCSMWNKIYLGGLTNRIKKKEKRVCELENRSIKIT